MDWIINNKEWIFSGIGVVVIVGIIKYFWSARKINKTATPDNSINQSIGTGINATFGSVKVENNEQNVNPKPDNTKSKK